MPEINDTQEALIRGAYLQLKNLGGADSIAAFFREHGITGKPEEPPWCPVANWVNKQVQLPPGTRFCINHLHGYVETDGGREIWSHRFGLTPVSLFTRMFDEGEYPELVAS